MDIVAMDCEMIPLNDEADTMIVVRVCMCDMDGQVLYDTYVKPTPYSITKVRAEKFGFRYKDLKKGTPYLAARERVASTIRDHLLVGYNVDQMLKALEIGHPRQKIRDIAKYTPLINRYGDGVTPCSLKDLAIEVLGWEIQEDMKNNPIENVKAAMEIFLKFEW